MPSSEHAIRLAGPWEMLNGEEWLRVNLPGDLPKEHLASGDEQGLIRLRRSFHCPTNLGDSDSVDVEIPTNFGTILAVQLDGQPVPLSPRGERRHDLTSLVHRFHRLELTVKPLASTQFDAPRLLITTGD
ncbi:MAG: hypothetical protein KDA58_10290 [Planctomycetaceae bacterium]|nr:hypothetical protein [Planctomycetaceae bacterium]